MAFCLNKGLAAKFKKSLKTGEINPGVLVELNSEERRAFFDKMLGKENGKDVNALFESKLLLKNQVKGMITWAKQVGGLRKPVKRDLISRIEKMDTILSPENENQFLGDLAAKKIGFDVTQDEAKTIMELSMDLRKKREALFDEDGELTDDQNARLEFGASKVTMENYLNGLKLEAGKESLTDQFGNPKEIGTLRFLKGLPVNIAKNTGKNISRLSGLAKSLKATMDNSFIGRQGIKALLSGKTKIWGKSFLNSFKILGKQIASKNDIIDAVKTEVYSRENFVNDKYKKLGIDIGTGEEAFPTTFPEKIPGLGRIFKASEAAFTGSAMRMRADLADYYIDMAERQGVDLDDKFEAQSLGHMINAMTGRGDIGRLASISEGINNTFFSLRFLKANVDTLLDPFKLNKRSAFVRRQAGKNLAMIVSSIAGTLALADALGADVEKDPRSSDFGKFRIGNTTFDVTGGMGSLATLAARMLTASSKSSSTGDIRELSTDFGAQSVSDTFFNFASNKLSPVASIIKQMFDRTAFGGEELTPTGVLRDITVPLPITNSIELMKDPNSANVVAALIADGLGISTNTFSPTARKRQKKIGDIPLFGEPTESQKVYLDIFDRMDRVIRGKELTPEEEKELFKAMDKGVEEAVFDDKERKELARDYVKSKTGFKSTTDEESLLILRNMEKKDQAILLSTYSEQTQKKLKEEIKKGPTEEGAKPQTEQEREAELDEFSATLEQDLVNGVSPKDIRLILQVSKAKGLITQAELDQMRKDLDL
jgi:hypothetical protein